MKGAQFMRVPIDLWAFTSPTYLYQTLGLILIVTLSMYGRLRTMWTPCWRCTTCTATWERTAMQVGGICHDSEVWSSVG